MFTFCKVFFFFYKCIESQEKKQLINALLLSSPNAKEIIKQNPKIVKNLTDTREYENTNNSFDNNNGYDRSREYQNINNSFPNNNGYDRSRKYQNNNNNNRQEYRYKLSKETDEALICLTKMTISDQVLSKSKALYTKSVKTILEYIEFTKYMMELNDFGFLLNSVYVDAAYMEEACKGNTVQLVKSRQIIVKSIKSVRQYYTQAQCLLKEQQNSFVNNSLSVDSNPSQLSVNNRSNKYNPTKFFFNYCNMKQMEGNMSNKMKSSQILALNNALSCIEKEKITKQCLLAFKKRFRNKLLPNNLINNFEKEYLEVLKMYKSIAQYGQCDINEYVDEMCDSMVQFFVENCRL